MPPTIQLVKSSEMFCRIVNNRSPSRPTKWMFADFYPSPFGVKQHMDDGKETQIFQVKLIEDTVGSYPQSYWAWWNLESYAPIGFQFCYHAKMLLKMCFPYGPQVEEERGNGLMLPVNVEIIDVLDPRDPKPRSS